MNSGCEGAGRSYVVVVSDTRLCKGKKKVLALSELGVPPVQENKQVRGNEMGSKLVGEPTWTCYQASREEKFGTS